MLEAALILERKRYSIFYHAGVILVVILMICLLVIFTYKYQSYYLTLGTMIDGKLELLVNIDDMKYVTGNDRLYIESDDYTYQVFKIDEKLYRDESYNNYKNIYLVVDNLNNIDNYVYEIKIPKEYKSLAYYIKNLVKEA